MADFEGARVLRGPDWEGGNVDGGEGYLGTVIQSLGNQTVRVLWDMGRESTCSAGQDGKFELRIYDTAQAGVWHQDRTCAECKQVGIWGMLWRCQDCTGCDLCPVCYSEDKHDIRHRFLRIDTPGCEGLPFPKRKTSVKVRAIGIFPGAKVVRGKDWEWGDQDGGQGSEGEVKAFEAVPSRCCRSMISVGWPHGETNSYRLGLLGKVDLQCVEEDVGPCYYRDHLPVLDTAKPSLVVTKSSQPASTSNKPDDTTQQPSNTEVPPTKVSSPPGGAASASVDAAAKEGKAVPASAAEEELSVFIGDRVAIKVPEEKLRELQVNRGGCTEGLAKCIGKTGKVLGFERNGSVGVNFGSSLFNYTINPKALIKVHGRFSKGDVVRVRDDLELLKRLNTCMTWVPDMDKTAGRVGRVLRVSSQGDLFLDFKGVQFAYSSACCLPAPGATVDVLGTNNTEGGEGKASDVVYPAYQSEDNDKMALFRALRNAVKAGDADQAINVDEFYAAVEFGRLDLIRQTCQQDPTMVERENQGLTPLIFASLRGRLDSAVTLMDLGADVNRPASNDHRKTPLSAVLEGKSQEMADVLLSRGGDVKRVYTEGKTLVHLAAYRNLDVVLQALAKHGADMNAKDMQGNTALHIAIEGRQYRALDALLAMPQVDIHVPNGRTFHPLQLACFVDNPRAVAGLLARDKSRVDEKMGQGYSAAVHVAAINDHVECVRLLVTEGGGSVDVKQGHTQQTALHLACHKGRVETVEALLELGAAVNMEDHNGDTPLHLNMGGKIEGYHGQGELAAMQVTCRTEVAKMLISKGAYVDVKNHAGRHPLVYGYPAVREGVKAFMRNNKEVVKRKFGPDAESLFSTLDPATSARVEGGQIGDALKGVGLPCGVCGCAKSDVTLQPCQHKCLCSACSDKATKCPLCDVTITDKAITGQDENTVDPSNCKQM